MSRETNDLELVERFKSGDVAAFNELVRRYQERVYWLARRTVGSHDDANDVVQDVFVRVYEALRKFRAEANFYTWLYRITVNASLNAVRKKRIKEFLPYDDILAEQLPGDSESDRDVLQQEYRTVLEEAILKLPAKQRMVFVMRYHEELPFEEIAHRLKKSVGGTKANYFHALKKISVYVRKELEE
jgi:RNA polymerase sigma-70 factor, ECF subfamily